MVLVLAVIAYHHQAIFLLLGIGRPYAERFHLRRDRFQSRFETTGEPANASIRSWFCHDLRSLPSFRSAC
jgi:hypothetical protein